jgi:2-polyprenyl-3-methyl-5-hydroxy-6-metoxy-1,4-benzoquinol methylase
VERDFDRLASYDAGGWNGNNHYHKFLLRHVPRACGEALEIGCGTGAFSRRLAERAQHVSAIDLSSEMIRVARSRSAALPNIDFEVDDIVTRELPESQFDCIASIATLHHVPTHDVLVKIRKALKPGGSLIVLDLFEPERNILTFNGVTDSILNVVAMGTNCRLNLLRNGRLRPPREVRAAWEEHGKTDRYLTIDEARSLYGSLFAGVIIRQHLLWRYSAIWTKC